jgi:hypothetical protein
MNCRACMCIAICLLLTNLTYSQKYNDSVNLKPARSIIGELGGPGFLSINYDQRFKGNKGLGFRAGLGGIGVITAAVIAVPVGLNYLTGSGDHHAEFGAGLSALTITDGTDFFEESSSTIFGYIQFGYRYEPKKGLTGRIFACPLFTSEGLLPFFGGISLGIRL